jgi:hypothetical protein
VIPAVVIATGLGTRLRPLASARWPVLPVDRTPVLAYLLRQLADAACRTRPSSRGLAEPVEQFVSDGSSYGLEIAYAPQGSPEVSHGVVPRQASAVLVLAPTSSSPMARSAASPVPTASAPLEAPSAGRAVELAASSARARRVLAPLWAVGPAVATGSTRCPVRRRSTLDRVPAGDRRGRADGGNRGRTTRGLTTPFDLVEQNFPYLRSL